MTIQEPDRIYYKRRKYELVHELHFEQGHLVEAIDLSAEAAQRRSPTAWD